MNADFPCVCGHLYVSHEPTFGCCFACYNSLGEEKSFHLFKGDNLKYLEKVELLKNE
jgi:hypothetical protein